MSTERISKSRAGWSSGKRQPCRWCGRMPEGRRLTFCSDECVHEHKCRTSPSYQARQVEKRDRGICESCGRDCIATLDGLKSRRAEIQREITRADGSTYYCRDWGGADKGRGHCGHPQCEQAATSRYDPRFKRAWAEHCDSLSLPLHLRDLTRRLWEMDHRVPVVEGGGDCGLENLRTLCWACHRRETAELAARRAEAKRATKRKSDPQTELGIEVAK